MYLATRNSPAPQPVGTVEPREAALGVVVVGALGLAVWKLFFSKKKKLHIRGCRVGAGPKLRKVGRLKPSKAGRCPR